MKISSSFYSSSGRLIDWLAIAVPFADLTLRFVEWKNLFALCRLLRPFGLFASNSSGCSLEFSGRIMVTVALISAFFPFISSTSIQTKPTVLDCWKLLILINQRSLINVWFSKIAGDLLVL